MHLKWSRIDRNIAYLRDMCHYGMQLWMLHLVLISSSKHLFFKRICYCPWQQIMIICKCRWKIVTKDTFEVKTKVMISFCFSKKLFYWLKVKHVEKKFRHFHERNVIPMLLLVNRNKNFNACFFLIPNYWPQQTI